MRGGCHEHSRSTNRIRVLPEDYNGRLVFPPRALVAAAALAGAGCGRVAFDPVDGAIDTPAESADPCAAGLVALADDFDDGVTDPKWAPYENAGATVGEQAGALRIVPAASSTEVAYAGYVSRCTFDLRASGVTITVAQLPTLGTMGTFGLILDLDTRELGFDHNTGNLLARWYDLSDGSSIVYKTVPFDPVQHHVWRLRGSAGQLLWETSDDGSIFTTFHAMTPAFDLSAVTVEMYGGTFQPVAAPGVIGFDDLRIAF